MTIAGVVLAMSIGYRLMVSKDTSNCRISNTFGTENIAENKKHETV